MLPAPAGREEAAMTRRRDVHGRSYFSKLVFHLSHSQLQSQSRLTQTDADARISLSRPFEFWLGLCHSSPSPGPAGMCDRLKGKSCDFPLNFAKNDHCHVIFVVLTWYEHGMSPCWWQSHLKWSFLAGQVWRQWRSWNFSSGEDCQVKYLSRGRKGVQSLVFLNNEKLTFFRGKFQVMRGQHLWIAYLDDTTIWGAWKTRRISVVFSILRKSCLKIRNYTVLYGKKLVQTDFLMLFCIWEQTFHRIYIETSYTCIH